MTTLPTAPAIISAIHDATGVRIEELPATAEKVLMGMRETQILRKNRGVPNLIMHFDN